jgi:hypothetical protein
MNEIAHILVCLCFGNSISESCDILFILQFYCKMASHAYHYTIHQTIYLGVSILILTRLRSL